MNDRHKKWVEQIAIIARDTPKVHGARIAAAIVRRRNLLSIGTNSQKTDPFHFRFSGTQHKITLHAETAAIKNALRNMSPRELKGATLYVVRVKGDDLVTGMAKPCKACMKAIIQYEIGSVVYTDSDGGISSI